MISREQILKQGYVDVKVFVSGLRQSHRLQVVKEKTVHGVIPFLVATHYIPAAELVKLAEELQLPVKHKNMLALPKGKTPKDFAEKGTGAIAVAEPATVEAEVED